MINARLFKQTNRLNQMNFQKNFKSLVDLVSEKKESLFILGLCVLPFLSIIRVFCKPIFENYPFFSTIFTIFIFGVNVFFVSSIFFWERFSASLSSWFIFLLNTKVFQRLLFFFLFLEQILKLHFLIFFTFVCSWTFFIIEFFKLYPDLAYLLQTLFIFLTLYIRFRNKMLGQKTLLAVEAIEPNQGSLTWKEVMDGLNLQMIQLEKNSKFHALPNGVKRDRDLQPVFNRYSDRNDVVFPFFFYTARRQMAFRAAFKTLSSATLSAFERSPITTTVAIGSTVGATIITTYEIGAQQQTIAQTNRKLDMKEKELDIKGKELGIKEKELDIKDKELALKDKELAQQNEQYRKTIGLKEKELGLKKKELDMRVTPSANPSGPSPSVLDKAPDSASASGVLEKKDVALLENTDSIGRIGLVEVVRGVFDIFDSI